MASFTLHSFAGDFRKFKALIAAQYNGVSVTCKDVEMGKDNVTKPFLAMNPLGKVPVLETAEGCIFESNAIARYIARLRRDTELYGVSFYDTGRVDTWLDFASLEVETAVTMWIHPIFGYAKFNGATYNMGKRDLLKALSVMEKHLLYNTYMVGNKISLADIALVSALFYPMKMVLDAGIRAKIPSVVRWFQTCVAQPAFAAVLGADVPLCETALQPAGMKGGKAKGGKGGNKQAAKKQQPKKEKKAAPAPKPVVVKKARPFDSAPKTKARIDEWKGIYANAKVKADAVDKFWDWLDAEGYSVFIADYQYNAENQKGFMTCNLVAGFIQRCEEILKGIFGIIHILEGPPFACTGAFVIRGVDEKEMIQYNPDAEYWKWTRVNPESEEDRAKLKQMWGATDKLGDAVIYDTRECY